SHVLSLLCSHLSDCDQASPSGTSAHGSSSTDDEPPPDTDGGAVQGGIDAGRPARLFCLRITVNGQGSIQSSPAGINCGQACAASFDQGTSVALTAAPASGFRFDSWGGACSGPGGCTVTMQGETQVSATFAAIPPTQH